MGDRFIIPVTCPCGHHDEEAYYAPTCGFVDWVCPRCGVEIDLEELTGISVEDASNLEEIEMLIRMWVGDPDSECGFDGLSHLLEKEEPCNSS